MLQSLEKNAGNLKEIKEKVTTMSALWKKTAQRNKYLDHMSVQISVLELKMTDEFGAKRNRSDPLNLLREEGLKLDWLTEGDSVFILEGKSETEHTQIFYELTALLTYNEFGFKLASGPNPMIARLNNSQPLVVVSPKRGVSLEYLSEEKTSDLRSSLLEEKTKDSGLVLSADVASLKDLGQGLVCKTVGKENSAEVVFKKGPTEKHKKKKGHYETVLTLPLKGQTGVEKYRTVTISQVSSKDQETHRWLFVMFFCGSRDYLYKVDLDLVRENQHRENQHRYVDFSVLNLNNLRLRYPLCEAGVHKTLTLNQSDRLLLTVAANKGNIPHSLASVQTVEVDQRGAFFKSHPLRYSIVQYMHGNDHLSFLSTRKGMKILLASEVPTNKGMFSLRTIDSTGNIQTHSELRILAADELQSSTITSIQGFSYQTGVLGGKMHELVLGALVASTSPFKHFLRLYFLERAKAEYTDFDLTVELAQLTEEKQRIQKITAYLLVRDDYTVEKCLQLVIDNRALILSIPDSQARS
jgi:hypothetical protein